MAHNPVHPQSGVASFATDTVGGTIALLYGDTPQVVTQSASYTAAQATAGIPIHTAVFVNPDTFAISLVDGTTIEKANAITTVALPAGSVGAGRLGVYKAGNFNVNALNFPAAFSTEAQKLAAFDQASCQIYVNKPYYS